MKSVCTTTKYHFHPSSTELTGEKSAGLKTLITNDLVSEEALRVFTCSFVDVQRTVLRFEQWLFQNGWINGFCSHLLLRTSLSVFGSAGQNSLRLKQRLPNVEGTTTSTVFFREQVFCLLVCSCFLFLCFVFVCMFLVIVVFI